MSTSNSYSEEYHKSTNTAGSQKENNPVPKSETPNSAAASDTPNGGLDAWNQVAGSFFLFFNGWGLISSFGVYQTYYELDMLSHKSASEISWIGSIQAFLLLIVGVLTGPLFDFGHFRALILVGCSLQVFGMVMVSICKEYWQVVLAQALVVGAGSGCVFIPSVAILPTYFSTRKGVANGLAASGSGFGGIIYPIVFQQLQPKIGFGWATRVIAFIMLATSIVPLALMKMRTNPPTEKKKLDVAAWREPPYTLWTISAFLGFLGLFTPLFYVGTFAVHENIMSIDDAFYLLPILNAGSIFGRLLPNFAVDKTGPLNMFVPSILVASILCFAWMGVKNTAGVVVFSFLYGIASGLILTLPAISIISLSPNLGVVGTRMGMAFAVSSLGMLIGTPIAGAIVKSGWTALQTYSGTVLIFSASFMFAARVWKVGFGFAIKG